MSKDNSSLTALQRARILSKGISNELWNPATLEEVNALHSMKKGIPMLEFKFLVEDGTSIPKTVTKPFFFGENGCSNTCRGLDTMVETVFDFKLSDEDYENIERLAEKCSELINRTVEVKEEVKDGYINYLVRATAEN